MDEADSLLKILNSDATADINEKLKPFQARPNLLDTVLPRCLALLAQTYLESSHLEPLRTIYAISRVRGYKVAMQHLPTEFTLINTLLNGIENLEPHDWQSQFTFLLWLAQVILVPFDLSKIGNTTPRRLYDCAMSFLGSSGVQRDVAALLMARLLTRGNAIKNEWTVDKFYADCKLQHDISDFKSAGILRVLAIVIDRSSEPPACIESMIEAEMLGEPLDLPIAINSVLSSQLWIKILGRTALKNVDMYSEFAISECISKLDNKSVKIRVSSAKYVGKIAQKIGRLDGGQESVVEVFESIIDSLAVEEVRFASDSFWNGALIAIAELVRRQSPHFWDIRKYFLEPLVKNVLTSKALHFVQNRLRTQVGSTVRDAACYVCWSLFRHVSSLEPSIRAELFDSLIALACLDSEVNVRRAAAAALQEGLGRQNHNMDPSEIFRIMNAINFHSVSLISDCYMKISVQFWSNAWVSWFLVHGVFSMNPETRRLAASASPLVGCNIGIVDALLDAEVDDMQAIHGRAITLGAIYSSGCQHRQGEAAALIEIPSPNDSDLIVEAMLRLAVISPLKTAELMEHINSDNTYVISAAESLVASSSNKKNLFDICIQRMAEGPVFVACLVVLAKVLDISSTSIQELMHLSNPRSRAMSCQLIEIENSGLILKALRDYAVDRRGDVGSWVREAAVRRVCENEGFLNTELGNTIRSEIWKMAADCPQKIRLVCGKALFTLKEVRTSLDPDSSENYYFSLLQQCPYEYRDAVLTGIVSSVGAMRASVNTIEGSFRGLMKYLNSNTCLIPEGRHKSHLIAENDSDKNNHTLGKGWVFDGILHLNKQGPLFPCIVKTIKRLVVADFKPAFSSNQVLALAFNATLQQQQEDVLVDAIDILQCLPPHPKVRSRLINMVKLHKNGHIRQRSAEALFELGLVSNEVLETTDWTSSNWSTFAQKLE